MFSVKFRELLLQTPGAFEEFDRFYKELNTFLTKAHHADGTLISPAPALVSEIGLAVGTCVPYAGTTAPPTGWLVCNGAALSRSTYRTLFLAIGTTWGVGDGATTFNLPDFRGRAVYGVAASGTGSTLGGTFGAMDHTHTGPSHTHTLTTAVPSATVAVQAGAGTTVATDTHTHTATTAAGGAGNTGVANAPGAAANWIILYA